MQAAEQKTFRQAADGNRSAFRELVLMKTEKDEGLCPEFVYSLCAMGAVAALQTVRDSPDTKACAWRLLNAWPYSLCSAAYRWS